MPDLDFLKSLTAARGVSGFESPVQSVFLERIRPCAHKLRSDLMGSVWGTINSGGNPKILLECHADEIGFCVRFISDDGLVWLQPVGRHSLASAVGQRITIAAKEGPVCGVIGTKPFHVQSDAERGRVPGITEIWADIGARNAAEASKMVSLGDPVSFCAPLTELGGRRVCSQALDNRAGMYAAALAFERLSASFGSAEVTVLSAVQEEVGMRGAEAAAAKIAPDAALIFDVCHTSDTPGIDKRLLGDVRIGGGPVIVRGPNVSPAIFKRLAEVADGFGIKCQIQPSGGVTSTDAAPIQVAGAGTAVGIIAIPIRYMHTPGEVAEMADLEAASELAEAFVRSCSADMKFDELLRYN